MYTPSGSSTGRAEALWFDEQRGFGFINPDGVRQWPVFVEYSRIDVPGYRTLAEGQPVRYLCDPQAHGRAAAVVCPCLPAMEAELPLSQPD